MSTAHVLSIGIGLFGSFAAGMVFGWWLDIRGEAAKKKDRGRR